MIILTQKSNKEDGRMARQVAELQRNGFKLKEMYKDERTGNLVYKFIQRKKDKSQEQLLIEHLTEQNKILKRALETACVELHTLQQMECEWDIEYMLIEQAKEELKNVKN